MTLNQNDRLSLRTRLSYGVGDVGINMTDAMVGLLFAIFLTDVVGLQPGLAALAIFLGRSSDYINDPIIGYLSDRTRTRWGRRRPFILFGIIPFALAYMILWWRPPIESQTWLAIYYGVAFILYDTTATILYMPYFALTPELTSDYDERTTLTTYRMAFSIIGAMFAFVLPLAVIGSMSPEKADRVFVVGAAIALISVLPMIFVFLGTRERTEFQQLKQPDLKESILATIQNRPFLIVVSIFLMTWLALDLVQTSLIYYLTHVMGLESQVNLVFGLLIVAALVSLPLWDWTAHHWDKRIAYISGMIFFSITVIGMGLLSPGWGLPSVLVLAGMAGVGLGAIQIIPWSMIPDVVEWDEYQTGQRHEGMFYSLVTLLRKVASSFAIPLVLLVLEWTGYVANSAEQPLSAIRGIKMMIGPVPALFLSFGILCALFFPLTRQRHAELRAELARRTAE